MLLDAGSPNAGPRRFCFARNGPKSGPARRPSRQRVSERLFRERYVAVLLQLFDAHKSYGPQVLLDGAEVTLTDDAKIGFIGRNGAGKSTLCRVLLGDEELDKGQLARHPKLRLGYLRQ